MKNLEVKFIEALKEIHEQDIKIQELKNKRQKDFDVLNKSLHAVGLEIIRCKQCMGIGEVSYTYGYQDGCTGYTDCSECHGTGYLVVDLFEK